MQMARTRALCLISIAISCGGLPTNYEYQYAPGHDYATKDYSFSYGVKDLHTGDVKNQWEKKTGDQVTGQYSVVEPDGSVRIVDYTVDGDSGFNAVVKHKGVSYHPQSKKPTSYNQIVLKNREKLDEISTYINKPKEEHSAYTYEYKGDEGDDKAIPSNHKSVYTKINEDAKLSSYTEEVPTEYLKDTIVTSLSPKDEENTYYEESESKIEPEKKTIYYIPESDDTTEGKNVKYFYYADDDEFESPKTYYAGESEYQTRLKYEKLQAVRLQEKILPLPIDLTLLNRSLSGRGGSLKVDRVKPVVIDLSHKPQGSYGLKFKTPMVENGFKPVGSKYSQPISEIANTYVTNVHPKSTPGLMNYAGGHYPPTAKLPVYRGPTTNKNGPVQFPNNREVNKDKVRRNPPARGSRRPKIMKFVTYYHK